MAALAVGSRDEGTGRCPFGLTLTIVTRESYSLEANNALLFYLFVHLFLVPSLLEGASNFCETHGGRYSRCRIRSENCGFMTSMS